MLTHQHDHVGAEQAGSWAAFLGTAAYRLGVGLCSANQTSESECLQTEERARARCPSSRDNRNRKQQATCFFISCHSLKERSSLHCFTRGCHINGCLMHTVSLSMPGTTGDFSREASSPGFKSSQRPEAVSWHYWESTTGVPTSWKAWWRWEVYGIWVLPGWKNSWVVSLGIVFVNLSFP